MTNTVNPNKYKVEFSSLESIQELVTKAQTSTALPQILDAAEEAVQAVKEKASLWTTLVSFFANLFGKVSDYQRLMQKVENLERELQKKINQLFSSTNETHSNEAALLANKLAEAKAEIKTLGAKISSNLNNLINEFDEVDGQLAGLEQQCCKENQTEGQLLKKLEKASEIANFLKNIQTSIDALSQMYYDTQDNDFTPIIILAMRYEEFEKQLKAIQIKLANQMMDSQKDNKKPLQNPAEITPTSHIPVLGGIQNGGNSCYVASAIQTINAIPSYRKAFDPEQNPLKQGPGETQDFFKQRLTIQKLGYQILQKIQSGQITDPDEINAFRKTCYDHKQVELDDNSRVIKSLGDTGDASEFLESVLTTMGYQFGSYQVQSKKTPVITEHAVRYDINPASVSSFEDFTKEKLEIKENPTLEVSPYNYLGKSIDMQRLIDETWADGHITDVWIQGLDDEGKPCVKEYSQCILHSEAVAKEAPEVFYVTVTQPEENKATITKADKIFPFGNSQGPEYELKAIIEHRPGHYVAHIIQNDGSSIEANDSWVHAGKKDIPGVAYYYVRAESNA